MNWKEARLAEIDRRAAAMRVGLEQFVVSVEPFEGSLPGARVVAVPVGKFLRANHALVERYPGRFRRLTAREIENRVRGWIQRTRSGWNVG